MSRIGYCYHCGKEISKRNVITILIYLTNNHINELKPNFNH